MMCKVWKSSFLIRILRWDNSYKTLIEISLPIILYLHFIHNMNSSISYKNLFAYLLRIRTFVHMITSQTFYPIMLCIPRELHDKVWYKQLLFYKSNFSIPNRSASPFIRVVLKEISFQIILVWSHSYPCIECSSIPLSNFFLPLELEDKFFDKSAGLLKAYFLIVIIPAAISLIPKYNKEDLQQIFMTVLEV